jgi:repressor LexA
MLGMIAAGMPLPDPVGPPQEFIDVETPLLPTRYDNLFALRVQGDSMIDALIRDGDYVILRHQETANPGDMVAAWITCREEATLKYYYPEGSRVHLVSDNIQVEPIVVEAADLQIKGVVSFFLPGNGHRKSSR